MMKPVYKGTGEVYLEPSFRHYLFMSLDNDSIIVDKGLFYCCSDTIEVKAFTQRTSHLLYLVVKASSK